MNESLFNTTNNSNFTHEFYLQQNLNIPLIIICPLIILTGLTLAIFFIIRKSTPDGKFRIITYHLLQFLLLPLMMIFFIINVFLIVISYIFCKSLKYISVKNTFEFLKKTLNKLKCKKSVNTIKIIKKQSIELKLPERANRYKEVNNDSKLSKQDQTKELNLNNIKPSLFNENNYRPPNTQKQNKGKILDFLSKNLIGEDNTPVYINLINNIKKKTKGIKEKEANASSSVVINP